MLRGLDLQQRGGHDRRCAARHRRPQQGRARPRCSPDDRSTDHRRQRRRTARARGHSHRRFAGELRRRLRRSIREPIESGYLPRGGAAGAARIVALGTVAAHRPRSRTTGSG
ncbi:MAG: hypothetical protein R2713_00500 [Ilumatobacteraceae bacterium]